MEPAEIAAALREIATYLELEGERFRARAYVRAARSVDATHDLRRLIDEGRLTELPGLGESLARLVAELADHGTVPLLERLRAAWPPVVLELARLPGVGTPKARKLYEELKPRSVDELADLADAGKIRVVQGFGKVSEAKIRDAIRGRHARGATVLLEVARELSVSLAAHVRASPAAVEVLIAGAPRRWIEVVDTLALAVATDDEAAVRARLGSHPLVVSLNERGPGLAVARLASGVLCELHTAPPARFGAAAIRATGSEAHVAALGLDLETATGADEAAVYAAIGLPWIPPEVRDGTDEIAAARAGDDFADLIALEDLTTVVHCHTVYSDGKNTVAEMARAAAKRGLAAITITDHSPTAHYAGGLTIERLHQQWAEIDEVQKKADVEILRGTESDIRKDGTLDYPDDVLAEMDIVIASIHNRYKLDEDGMTARIVRAMREPIFKIWGHALGRLVMSRPPIDVRFDEILDAICDSPAAIEINGDPKRLDLEPSRARRARDRGVRFVLGADAHSTRQLEYLENAVGIARRARIRRQDVLNALPPDEFAKAVRPAAKRARRARRAA
jgi:DNA polymerase (family 10)